VREERVVLEYEPDPAALDRHVHPGAEPALAVALDLAPLRPQQAGDEPQDRRFARARRPDERDGRGDLELDVDREVADGEGQVGS
jgi:hypothetical protein